MKSLRYLIVVLLLTMFFGLAAVLAQEAKSVNAVGYVKVESAGNSLILVAPPCNPPGSGTNQFSWTLDELIGTNLTAHWSATDADVAYIWSGTKYEEAFLNNDGWDWYDPALNWKWCWMDGDGNPQLCASNTAYDIKVGQGFWIRNRNTSKTLFFLGEVPMVSTTTTDMVGLMLIANPYPVDKTLNDLISTNDGAYAHWSATDADVIYAWSGTKYDEYFLNNDGWDWYDPALNWKWCWMDGDGNPQLATNLIAPAQGFWYRARGGTFSWEEPKAYLYP